MFFLRTVTNDDGSVHLEDMPEVTVEIPKFEEDEPYPEDGDEVDQEPIDSDDSVADSDKDEDEHNDAGKVDENESPTNATSGKEVAVKKQGQKR